MVCFIRMAKIVPKVFFPSMSPAVFKNTIETANIVVVSQWFADGREPLVLCTALQLCRWDIYLLLSALSSLATKLRERPMVGRCESILHGTCIQGFLWHLYLALHYFSGLALRAAMVKANCCLRLRSAARRCDHYSLHWKIYSAVAHGAYRTTRVSLFLRLSLLKFFLYLGMQYATDVSYV